MCPGEPGIVGGRGEKKGESTSEHALKRKCKDRDEHLSLSGAEGPLGLITGPFHLPGRLVSPPVR